VAEIRLASIRIGFDYAVEIDFPVGFLEAEESIRMKLRRFNEDPVAIEMLSERTGDTITLSLTAAQTADMIPCSYVGEAVVYQPDFPAEPEVPLTNNRYIADCDHSPSE
jgi:hypothetical protein